MIFCVMTQISSDSYRHSITPGNNQKIKTDNLQMTHSDPQATQEEIILERGVLYLLAINGGSKNSIGTIRIKLYVWFRQACVTERSPF